MTDDPIDRAGVEGLRFFGAATASLSHELRNVLATVQQAAGLLDDYAALMAQGRPVDRSRFQTVTARVGRNADKGLGYIDLLNWLGHSLDGPRSSLELGEIVAGAIGLARYRARQRRIALELAPGDGDAVVIGTTFEWAMFVHRCLESIMDESEVGATVSVTIDGTRGDVVMGFETDAARSTPGEPGTTRARPGDLARALGGRLEARAAPATGRRFAVHFPHCPETRPQRPGTPAADASPPEEA